MWTVLFPSVGVRFRQWVNLEKVYFLGGICWRGQIWERCAFVDFDRSNVVVQPPCSCSAVVAEKRLTGQLFWLS